MINNVSRADLQHFFRNFHRTGDLNDNGVFGEKDDIQRIADNEDYSSGTRETAQFLLQVDELTGFSVFDAVSSLGIGGVSNLLEDIDVLTSGIMDVDGNSDDLSLDDIFLPVNTPTEFHVNDVRAVLQKVAPDLDVNTAQYTEPTLQARIEKLQETPGWQRDQDLVNEITLLQFLVANYPVIATGDLENPILSMLDVVKVAQGDPNGDNNVLTQPDVDSFQEFVPATDRFSVSHVQAVMNLYFGEGVDIQNPEEIQAAIDQIKSRPDWVINDNMIQNVSTLEFLKENFGTIASGDLDNNTMSRLDVIKVAQTDGENGIITQAEVDDFQEFVPATDRFPLTYMQNVMNTYFGEGVDIQSPEQIQAQIDTLKADNPDWVINDNLIQNIEALEFLSRNFETLATGDVDNATLSYFDLVKVAETDGEIPVISQVDVDDFQEFVPSTNRFNVEYVGRLMDVYFGEGVDIQSPEQIQAQIDTLKADNPDWVINDNLIQNIEALEFLSRNFETLATGDVDNATLSYFDLVKVAETDGEIPVISQVDVDDFQEFVPATDRFSVSHVQAVMNLYFGEGVDIQNPEEIQAAIDQIKSRPDWVINDNMIQNVSTLEFLKENFGTIASGDLDNNTMSRLDVIKVAQTDGENGIITQAEVDDFQEFVPATDRFSLTYMQNVMNTYFGEGVDIQSPEQIQAQIDTLKADNPDWVINDNLIQNIEALEFLSRNFETLATGDVDNATLSYFDLVKVAETDGEIPVISQVDVDDFQEFVPSTNRFNVEYVGRLMDVYFGEGVDIQSPEQIQAQIDTLKADNPDWVINDNLIQNIEALEFLSRNFETLATGDVDNATLSYFDLVKVAETDGEIPVISQVDVDDFQEFVPATDRFSVSHVQAVMNLYFGEGVDIQNPEEIQAAIDQIKSRPDWVINDNMIQNVSTLEFLKENFGTIASGDLDNNTMSRLDVIKVAQTDGENGIITQAEVDDFQEFVPATDRFSLTYMQNVMNTYFGEGVDIQSPEQIQAQIDTLKADNPDWVINDNLIQNIEALEFLSRNFETLATGDVDNATLSYFDLVKVAETDGEIPVISQVDVDDFQEFVPITDDFPVEHVQQVLNSHFGAGAEIASADQIQAKIAELKQDPSWVINDQVIQEIETLEFLSRNFGVLVLGDDNNATLSANDIPAIAQTINPGNALSQVDVDNYVEPTPPAPPEPAPTPGDFDVDGLIHLMRFMNQSPRGITEPGWTALDVNEDGNVDELDVQMVQSGEFTDFQEMTRRFAEFYRFPHTNGLHHVQLVYDQFDLDGDGIVDADDVALASSDSSRSYEKFQAGDLASAFDRLANWEWRHPDGRSSDLNVFNSHTARILDINGDGTFDEADSQLVASGQYTDFHGLATRLLNEVGNGRSLTNHFLHIVFDYNRDGVFDSNDLDLIPGS